MNTKISSWSEHYKSVRIKERNQVSVSTFLSPAVLPKQYTFHLLFPSKLYQFICIPEMPGMHIKFEVMTL